MNTVDQKASCVICSDSFPDLKEHILQGHFETKHLASYSRFTGKLRSKKYDSMKRGLESQRNLFTKNFAENEFVARKHCEIVQRMAERRKPFTDFNFII